MGCLLKIKCTQMVVLIPQWQSSVDLIGGIRVRSGVHSSTGIDSL